VQSELEEKILVARYRLCVVILWVLRFPSQSSLSTKSFHEELEEATLEDGPIGEAAKAVNKVLAASF